MVSNKRNKGMQKKLKGNQTSFKVFFLLNIHEKKFFKYVKVLFKPNF